MLAFKPMSAPFDEFSLPILRRHQRKKKQTFKFSYPWHLTTSLLVVPWACVTSMAVLDRNLTKQPTLLLYYCPSGQSCEAASHQFPKCYLHETIHLYMHASPAEKRRSAILVSLSSISRFYYKISSLSSLDLMAIHRLPVCSVDGS